MQTIPQAHHYERRPLMASLILILTTLAMIALGAIQATSCHANDLQITKPAPTADEPAWSKYLAQQEGWTAGDGPGQALLDGTRVDIIGPDTVWEVEWLHNGKWKESFGQATYYAAQTGKRPGVWMLYRGDADKDDLLRFQITLQAFELGGYIYQVRITDVTK